MTPQEINDIKDKAAKEFGREDWNTTMRFASNIRKDAIIDRAIELAFEKGKKAVIEGYTADEVERAVDANISAKREIKVPSEEEILTQFPKPDLSELDVVDFMTDVNNRYGARWAIEKIKEMNK